MKTTRRRYDAHFKAQVAMDAIQGIKTMAELAHAHQIHPGQIQAWKKHLQDEAATLFQRVGTRAEKPAGKACWRRCTARSAGWRSSWTS
jgi:transposase-like protein